MDSTNDLREAIQALDWDELAFLIKELTTRRDELAETRPKIADAINAALGILDDDRADRPARRRAEVAELEGMATGHIAVADDDLTFGWSGERPKQNQ